MKNFVLIPVFVDSHCKFCIDYVEFARPIVNIHHPSTWLSRYAAEQAKIVESPLPNDGQRCVGSVRSYNSIVYFVDGNSVEAVADRNLGGNSATIGIQSKEDGLVTQTCPVDGQFFPGSAISKRGSRSPSDSALLAFSNLVSGRGRHNVLVRIDDPCRQRPDHPFF